MIRAVLAFLLVSGCASAPDDTRFDADGWLDRADIAAIGPEAGDPSQDLAKRYSAELDAAVGWREACDRRWDPRSEEMVSENGSYGWTHGTYTIHDTVGGGAVVAVTCDFGAYQGTYALASIAEGQASLLTGQQVGLLGEDFGPPVAVYSTPAFDGDATFTTLALARGIGDCGIFSTYEITAPNTATLLEARARDCDGAPDAAGAPDTWPVVYPRR